MMTALMLLSIIVWLFGLMTRGVVDPSLAVMALIGLTVLAGIARASGTGIWSTAMRVGLPIASLFTFASVFGTEQMWGVMGGAAVVLAAMMGLYIMVGGRPW